jgi:hypothetical protein
MMIKKLLVLENNKKENLKVMFKTEHDKFHHRRLSREDLS